jgi:hypothetical protein
MHPGRSRIFIAKQKSFPQYKKLWASNTTKTKNVAAALPTCVARRTTQRQRQHGKSPEPKGQEPFPSKLAGLDPLLRHGILPVSSAPAFGPWAFFVPYPGVTPGDVPMQRDAAQ